MSILTFLLAALSAVPGIEIYQYAAGLQKSSLYAVSVAGQGVRVVPTEQAHIAQLGAEGEIQLDIIYLGGELRYADIRPMDKGYEYEIEGNTLKVKLKTFDRVSIEVNGDKVHPLLAFVNPLENKKAESIEDRQGVLCFRAGQIYPEKKIDLANYNELYIEGGAIVQAAVLATELGGIKISGCGILDCRFEKSNAVKFTECTKIEMENICILNSGMVACQFVDCNDVALNNVKAINVKTTSLSSEKAAFDWAGGKKVRADKIFAYSQSHAFSIHNKYGESSYTVDDFCLSDCVVWNVQTGNTIHIVGSDAGLGNIRFKDLYAIHSAGMPKPFYRSAVSIKQSGSKKIANLEFENLIAEDPGEYLFNLNGWIDGVRFSGLSSVAKAPFGASLRGTDFDHRVSNVLFENFTIAGQKVKTLKQSGVKSPVFGLNIIFK